MKKLEELLSKNNIPFEIIDDKYFQIFDEKIKFKKFTIDYVARFREWNYKGYDLIASATWDNTWKRVWLTTNNAVPAFYYGAIIGHYHRKILLKRLFRISKKPEYNIVDEKFVNYFVEIKNKNNTKKFKKILSNYIWREFIEKYNYLLDKRLLFWIEDEY